MAPREVVSEAILRLELENDASAEMTRAVEEFKAETAALGREHAEIKIKADISEYRRNLADARAELRRLQEEEKREAALNETLSRQAKSASTNRLANIRSEIAATRESITATDAEVRALQRKADVYQSVGRMSTQIARERTAAERENINVLKESLRAEEDLRTARARSLGEIERGLTLQKRYADAEARLIALRKTADRAQGTDRIRVAVDTAGALRQMEETRLALEAIGQKPIEIRTRVNRADENAVLGAAHRIADAFGFTRTDRVKDLSTRLGELATKAKDAHIRIGPLSTSLAGLVIGAGALAPVITGLVGSLGSLVAVLGAGVAGAAGVGAAGLTGFGLAALGIGANLRPFIKNIQEARQNLNTYNNAIEKYGANSKQGQTATKAWHNQLAAMDPTVRNIIVGFGQLTQQWQRLTKATADRQFANIIGATLKTVRADMGFFARDTNQALTSIAGEWSRFMAALRSPEAQHGIDTIFQNFNRSIPNIANALGHLGDVIGRLLVNFSQHLPALTQGFDTWAMHLDDASKRSGGFAQGVDAMVGAMQRLGHFTEAVGRFLIEFFRGGVEPGGKLLDRMTTSLNKLADQMGTVAGQRRLTDFFDRSNKVTLELWNSIKPLGSAFVQFSQAMAPVANVALQIVSLFTRMLALFIGFKPLQYLGGMVLAAVIIGRVTSALREGVGLLATFGTRLAAVARGQAGIGSIFKGAAPSSEFESAIVAGSNVGSERMSAAIIAGGTVAAERMGAASAAGGAFRGGGVIPGTVTRTVSTGERAAVTGAEAAGVGATVAGSEGAALSLGALAIPAVGIGLALAAPFIPALVTQFGKWLSGPSPYDLGKKFAQRFSIGANLQQRIGLDPKAAEDQNKQLAVAIGRLKQVSAPQFSFSVTPTYDTNAITKASKRVAQLITSNFEQEMNAHKGRLDQIGFIDTLLSTLRKTPVQARQAAAQMMIQYTAQLVAQGKLPQSALKRTIDLMRQQFPELNTFINQQIGRAGQIMQRGVRFEGARKTLENTLNGLRTAHNEYAGELRTDNDHILANATKMYTFLRTVASRESGKARQATLAEMKKIHDGVQHWLQLSVQTTDDHFRQIVVKSGRGSHNAMTTVRDNFNKLAQHIHDAEASGLLSVQEGNRLIDESVRTILKAYGVTIPGLKLAKSTLPGFLRSAPTLMNLPGVAARGALFPIGTPGAAKEDNIPISVNGTNIIVGEGETAAIFTRHQMAAANAHLAHIGGLAGLFDRYDRPHAMARGGIVDNRQRFAVGGVAFSGPASTFGPPTEAAGNTKSGASSASPGISLRIPGTHFSDPRNIQLVGHIFRVEGAGHTANLRDIDIGPADWTGKNVDVTGAGAQAMGINPLTFPTGAIFTVTELDAGAVTSLGGGAPTIPEPQVQGRGILKTIAQRALHLTTDAANKFIAAHLPAGTGAGAFGGGPFSGTLAGVIPGHPELQAQISRIVETVLQHFPQLQVTSTTGGSHVPGSYHYQGRAVDIAGPGMDAAAQWIISSGLWHLLVEGIHNPNLAVKNYQLETPPGVFGAVWAGHTNHIHLAAQRGALMALGSGGLFDRPTFLVGEDYNREYVISTQPEHAAANRGYLRDAASDLGMQVIPAATGFSARRRKRPPHPPAPVLPAKDRIGGIGTDDIQASLDAAQTTYDNYHQAHFTAGQHPTRAQRRQDHQLFVRLQNFKRMLASANQYIARFQNLETMISLLGTYMDAAAATTSDTASGLDPGTRQITTKTWAQWKGSRIGLETFHTRLLRNAAADARRIFGPHPSAQNFAYVLQLQNALGQSVLDLSNLQQETDPNAPTAIASLDDFITSIGQTGALQRLNYSYALAQMNNVPDVPGTPAREDIESLQDDLTAARDIMDFYQVVLTRAQAYRFAGQPDYPLMTEAVNQYTTARQQWQGIADEISQASQITGPSQVQLFGTAREALYDAFASNYIGGVVPSPTSTAIASAFEGGTTIPSSPTSETPTGNSYTLHNYFTTSPDDPHSWSKSLEWELGAL